MTAAPETTAAMERLKVALANRPGAGNLIGGKFIADPPVTILAEDARLFLSALASQLPTDGWEEAFKAWATVQYGNPDTPALSGHGLAFRAGYLAATPLPVPPDQGEG